VPSQNNFIGLAINGVIPLSPTALFEQVRVTSRTDTMTSHEYLFQRRPTKAKMMQTIYEHRLWEALKAIFVCDVVVSLRHRCLVVALSLDGLKPLVGLDLSKSLSEETI
jgi:hypothetical protein